jgi:hypothetical protein
MPSSSFFSPVSTAAFLPAGLGVTFLPPLAAVSKMASLAAVLALLVPCSALLGLSLPGGATVGLPTTEIPFCCGWSDRLVLVALEGGTADSSYGGGALTS